MTLFCSSSLRKTGVATWLSEGCHPFILLWSGNDSEDSFWDVQINRVAHCLSVPSSVKRYQSPSLESSLVSITSCRWLLYPFIFNPLFWLFIIWVWSGSRFPRSFGTQTSTFIVLNMTLAKFIFNSSTLIRGACPPATSWPHYLCIWSGELPSPSKVEVMQFGCSDLLFKGQDFPQNHPLDHIRLVLC